MIISLELFVQPVDLELIPIIERHIGNAPEGDDRDINNYLIAIKICELAAKADETFITLQRRQALAALQEMSEAIGKAKAAFRKLSVPLQRELDNRLRNWTIREFKITDLTLENIEDEGERLSRQIKQRTLGLAGSLQNALELVDKNKEDVSKYYVDRKVCKVSCVIAEFLWMVWTVRTGSPAPKSVHADGPGPFGRFLDDVLEIVFEAYDLGQAPTSRSALRALANVTKTETEITNNW